MLFSDLYALLPFINTNIVLFMQCTYFHLCSLCFNEAKASLLAYSNTDVVAFVCKNFAFVNVDIFPVTSEVLAPPNIFL